MAVVKATSKQIDLLARLMRAEAEGEGELGMLMVGNVGVNRVRTACLDFENIRNLEDADIRLAQRVVNGERFHPATRSLWFFDPGENTPCPAQWYGQWNTGRFKAHCFFSPTAEECPEI